MTAALFINLIFQPRYENLSYSEYQTPDNMVYFETGGTASLAISLESLFDDAEEIDIYRYIGLYFTTRDSQ